MLRYQDHLLDLGLFRRYFCYFFYFRNYETYVYQVTIKSKYCQANNHPLSAAPLLGLAITTARVQHQSELLTPFSHTHLHTYVISKSPFFKMLAVLNLSRRLQTYPHLLKGNTTHNVLLWRPRKRV